LGRKIFITYKYGDTDVPSLYWVSGQTRVRDYVTEIQDLLSEYHINKGELDGQDLSDFKDSTIASKLRDKIYNSSITIVIISKNMRNPYAREEDQWIPWEVSYSLKEHSRSDRRSLSNALLAVVLPDSSNDYSYFIDDASFPNCNCHEVKNETLFLILEKNMFNKKNPSFSDCPYHTIDKPPYTGFSSYMHYVKWIDFKDKFDANLDIAIGINEEIDDYNIEKSIIPD